MPIAAAAQQVLGKPTPLSHQDNVAAIGHASPSYYAMVHTPVPPGQVYSNPGARDAVEKEWKKLESKGAWDMSTVQEQHVVAAKAQKDGRPVHFGDLMALCHLKHSELAQKFQSYKGRARNLRLAYVSR